ncbi:hypothetical protein HanPSC8_Chr02g0051671 [Helianthus annuus]|nr:hypothetical protein HanPSC8_Chr02g0051671 [Helianthus annuus]
MQQHASHDQIIYSQSSPNFTVFILYLSKPIIYSSFSTFQTIFKIMKKISHLLFLCLVLTSLSPPQDHSNELNLSEMLKSFGEKAFEVAENVKIALEKTTGTVRIGDIIEGALKDSVVKMHDWDFYDSPKRICEDIKWNFTRNVFLMRSVDTICDVLGKVSFEEIRRVINWCHLLGFSTAYGIGVWVTFSSGYVLGKCLPKQEVSMMLNKMNMVCFRAMAYSVGVALVGFLASRGITREGFSNKMAMFQLFNLVSALCMMLINLIFLEPRATKCIVQRKKETWEIKSVAAEKLKKMNAYSSTLSVSTVVVLTWHLAYISQMLQARH